MDVKALAAEAVALVVAEGVSVGEATLSLPELLAFAEDWDARVAAVRLAPRPALPWEVVWWDESAMGAPLNPFDEEHGAAPTRTTAQDDVFNLT